MDAISWLAAALAAAVAALLLILRRQRRQKLRLLNTLQALLADPDKPVDISLEEGSFALLHNTLLQLVERLRRERLLRRQDTRDTADTLMRMSHQLKTPLSALKLYEELAPGPYSAQQRQLLERMEHLLSMLLKLEKLRAGGYPMRFEDCELMQPLKAAWGRVQPLWPETNLEVYGGARLRADRDWLEEAFMNLFKNACEHMPGGGRITVRLSGTEEAAHIALEDTGGGASPDDLPRLFERFFTGPSRAGGGGAGVGLSMVREIIRAHHGDISAQNVPGGLRFDITLPRMERHLTRT